MYDDDDKNLKTFIELGKEVNSGNNRTERMVTDCLPQTDFETVGKTRLHSSRGGICGILFLNRFYNIKQAFLLLLSLC